MIVVNNHTPYPVVSCEGVLPGGKRCLVVMLKYSGQIRNSHGSEGVGDKSPFVEADAYWPDEEALIPQHESDFVPFKPYCDVIASAYAYSTSNPSYPNNHVRAGIKIGEWQKGFDVIGDRQWRQEYGRWKATDAKPFYKIPLHYGNAFGGVDKKADREDTFFPNPLGRGYNPQGNQDQLFNQGLPNTQAFNEYITQPNQIYAPMALSPIGRHWSPRLQFAGTYDEHWRSHIAPLLPADFDARYYQCAPIDQQIPYLTGGETVELFGLTPDLYCQFVLPKLEIFFTIFHKNGTNYPLDPVIDTLFIDPEAQRYTMTWRAHYLIERDVFDLRDVLIGRVTKALLRARARNKVHYSSLERLIKDQEEGMAMPAYKLPQPEKNSNNPFYFAHMHHLNE